jgi:mono/diheme cytochrome c family protein
LLALATSNKIWLAVFAGIFIVFALVASFVLPRRNPDFPGEHGRNWFVVATIALFVAMMFAVAVFAQEDEEAAGREAGEVATETAPGGEPQPQETTGAPTTGETETGETATGDTGDGGGGNTQAGRQVFASQGCGSCHAFEAAGTNATVGPNLDESLEGDDAEHVRESIVDPGAEVESGFQPIMPTTYEQDLSSQQLDDLVAFLTQT